MEAESYGEPVLKPNPPPCLHVAGVIVQAQPTVTKSPSFPSTNYLVYNIGGPGNLAFRFMHPYRTETDSGRFVEFRA